MNIRKQRTHMCGISNPALRNLKSATGNSNVTPTKQLKITSGFMLPQSNDPRTFTTSQFYQDHNKPLHSSLFLPSSQLGGGKALL